MQLKKFLHRLRRDQSGAAGVLVGSSIMALIGAATLTVDLGSIYLAERRLQGIADAAAMAAASGDITLEGRDRALEMIARRNSHGITITSLTAGRFTSDQALAPAARFAANSIAPTAVRLRLK